MREGSSRAARTRSSAGSCRRLRSPCSRESCGAVVSASHNPAEYNGIKFFGPDGSKLGDEEEEAIEALLDGMTLRTAGRSAEAEGLGERYVDLVCERFGAPLDGLRLCVDCANGAMYEVAPQRWSGSART